MGKEPEEVTTIIKTVVTNSTHSDSITNSRDTAYEASSSQGSEVVTLAEKMDTLLGIMTKNAGICGICESPRHPAHLCPLSATFPEVQKANK